MLDGEDPVNAGVPAGRRRPSGAGTPGHLSMGRSLHRHMLVVDPVRAAERASPRCERRVSTVVRVCSRLVSHDRTDRLGRSVARAAMEGDPLFGTVEVTIEELAELLERHTPPRDQDAAPH